MVSAGHVGGTRGSGIVSCSGDVLSGVCVWLGAWVRGLCLGFNNPVGTGGVLDLCLGCGCVSGVGGEWVGVLDQHLLNITSLDSGFKMAAGTCRHCNYPNSRHIMTHIKQTQ